MKKRTKALSLIFLFFILAGNCVAQFRYIPYYGKNKIVYKKFEWSHYKTKHFNIYYYDQKIETLKKIGELAESSYSRISQELKHQLSDIVPVIYYNTYTEFEQNNLIQVSEGVLGVAEPILYRFLVRGDMPIDELQDLIEHELTHIFQYDLLYGGPGMALYALNRPPLWVIEGLAEYNTKKWSTWSSLIVRDAVLNDRIPEISKNGNLFSRHPLPRPPAYDFGHAIYEFIEKKYGKTTIREFWHSMKNSSLIKRPDPVKSVFNQTPKEFSHEFKKYLRSRFKEFLLKENPENYSITLGPEFPLNPYYFSFSHAISPSGDIVAALTYNAKDGDIDIVLISSKTGKILKNITRGYTLKYQSIKYEIDSSRGKSIAWSPSGDQIAFFARSGEKYSLFLVNTLTGKKEKSIKIAVNQPSGLSFLTNDNDILFTGFENGNHNIFKLNLQTKEVESISSDSLYQKAPVASPDGKLMAYTIKVGVYDKLFISPINNINKKKQLTFGEGNTITPAFSHDSKLIYFSGDQKESFNIYSINLETGDLKRYTDVRTGNFFPAPMPNKPNSIIFASFNKGSFQIFKSEFEGEVEKNIVITEVEPSYDFEKFEPLIKIDINKERIVKRKGIGKLFLMSRPPIDTIVSTDGSLWGGTSLVFSDLMADNIFVLSAYQVRDFRSYDFTYLNQKKRINYLARAYSYSIFYYNPYAYYDPIYSNLLNYRDAMAVRKMAGVNLAATYPLNLYYRVEAGLSFTRYDEEYFDPYLSSQASAQGNQFTGFINGNAFSAGLAFTGETTRFRQYGPAKGNTFRVSIDQAIPIFNSFLSNTTIRTDLRQYLYIGMNSLFAARFQGYFSLGKTPYISYWGGNNQVRSAYYYSIIANEGWFANFEFRFPLFNSATTLIGELGPIRGTLFFDISKAHLKGYGSQFIGISRETNQRIFMDAIGSYGFGFQFFFLGFPFHVEFVKSLEFPDLSSPFEYNRGLDWKTKFWIGYDF